MKNLTFILLLAISITSCRSAKKMMDNGNYDEAIDFSLSKIRGQDNPKTKYVESIEQSFAKISHYNLKEISKLKSKGDADSWDRIFDIYNAMDRRQEKIRPFLPLTSDRGYNAYFEFIDTDKFIAEAAKTATGLHYVEGSALLEGIEYQNKKDARDAHRHFEQIERYQYDYKDAANLKEKSYHYGQNRIVYTVKNRSRAFLPPRFNEDLSYLDMRGLSSYWDQFLDEEPESIPADYELILFLDYLDVSPERENTREYTDVKEIEDGFTYVLDANGNVKKDSTGTDLRVKNIVEVKANIIEILREKAAIVEGKLSIFDTHTGKMLDEIPVKAEERFESYASTFIGDNRALTEESKNKIGSAPLPFPDDLALLMDTSIELKKLVKRKIKKFSF